jgi:hypothetical protein
MLAAKQAGSRDCREWLTKKWAHSQSREREDLFIVAKMKYDDRTIAEPADRLAKATQEFLQLSRRASPFQINIALYLVRLLFERQQAPSPCVDAEIERVWKAIDSGRLHDIHPPGVH